MPSRSTFRRDLDAIEQATLDVLDRAAVTLAGDPADGLDHRRGADGPGGPDLHADCLAVAQRIVRLLACQAPVADDLRRVTALLGTLKHAERIGNQCAEITQLLADADGATRTPVAEDAIVRMRGLAGRQVTAARHAVVLRDAGLAHEVEVRDSELNDLNREVFRLAVVHGDTADARAWLMAMTMVARALERVGDNAVAIARLVPHITGERHRDDGLAPLADGGG